MEEQKVSAIFEKRDRRLKKYEEKGQYKNGVFYCKRGLPINEDRLKKYEKLCYYMINKFCPKQALYEASFDIEDLVNRCRLEVFLAILNGFDPEKALTPQAEEKRIQRQETLDVALDRAERSIVQGRLINYFRRTLWSYHPDQFGGSSISYEGLCEGINQEFQNDFFTQSDFSSEHSCQVEKLLTTLKNRGKAAARKQFFNLDQEERDRILSLLRDKASVMISPQTFGGDLLELSD